MAVLVTGGGGYIGSHMVWALIDAGEDVVVLDRLSTGFRWAIAPEAKFYEGDIADEALHETIFTENAIDAIIHFAGSIIVPESVSNPQGYRAGHRIRAAQPGIALWHFQADDRDHAARHGRRA
jgi:UDP-glucose 4-epimerase